MPGAVPAADWAAPSASGSIVSRSGTGRSEDPGDGDALPGAADSRGDGQRAAARTAELDHLIADYGADHSAGHHVGEEVLVVVDAGEPHQACTAVGQRRHPR